MITKEQIKEWVQEALQHPEAGAQIIEHIARRLDELTQRNEELLAENIALQSGQRVKEYEQRINHLDYQLSLIKRRFGGSLESLLETQAPPDEQSLHPAPDNWQVCIYDETGRVLRMALTDTPIEPGSPLATLHNVPAGEYAPRLLAVPESEELLFIFTSGRIVSRPVLELPGFSADWLEAPTPEEPQAGETLACLAPIGRLGLTEFFVQASRKGCVKKIRTTLGGSILANRYIGAGVNQPMDKTFSLSLCNSSDRLVLVSQEGYLVCLPVNELPFSIEEMLKLETSDHLVSAFPLQTNQAIAVMTQVGKILHWTEDRLEPPRSNKSRGQSLYSASRREQGVRVVGAGPFSDSSWAVVLDTHGSLYLQSLAELLGAGKSSAQGEVTAFCTYTPAAQLQE